jgi:cyclophilin family peptidyl-prolyl cis-trans isomerase
VRRSLALVLGFALWAPACSESPRPAPTSGQEAQREAAPSTPPAQEAPRAAEPATSPPPTPAPTAEATAPLDDPDEIAIVRMQDGGEIEIHFMPEKARKHVANFKTLAKQGFYDGTTFHRVIPGFMIQGGDPYTKDDDPTNDGRGGPAHTLAAEFNDVPHRRGIVSMARRSEPDSAGSQFFIMVSDAPQGSADWGEVLDGRYTVFGKVTRGMEVVDAIVASPRDARDRPLRDQRVASVRVLPAPAP